jgi:hypothetical protein
MLKIPLDPHCKNHLLANEHSHHICSQRQDATIPGSSFTLYFIVLYISLINRNCVLLYLYVYCCVSVISFLYYWMFRYISIHFFIISLLSFPTENNPDQYFRGYRRNSNVKKLQEATKM